jgi:predicted Zn-dependent peptidase
MLDERIVLPNGVEFCFKRMHDRFSSAVGVWVKEGARCEPKKYKGIAHYLEHLLFKGSKSYSYRKIKEEIEGKGGQLNAFTAQETTCYYARVLNKNIEPTLDILLDMVAVPLLKESDIERERQVIFEEINMYDDMPSSRVGNLVDKLLWPTDPLGIDVIGTQQSVAATDRAALTAFQSKFYRPTNIVVVLAGETTEQVKAIIAKRFPGTRARPTMKPQPKVAVPKGFVFDREIKQFQQTHMAVAFPGVDHHSRERFAMELLHTVLGGNMSSRLFESLREKRGLVYDVGTSSRKFTNTGSFMVHCGLEASHTKTAYELIMKEIHKIKTKPVPAAELRRAKDYLVGNMLIHFESTLNTMLYIGESIVVKESVAPIEKMREKFLGITADEILEAAQKHLDYDHMKVAVVTNQNDPRLEDDMRACVKNLDT